MSVPPSPAEDPDRWFAQEELSGYKVRLVPMQVEHAAAYLAALHSDNGAADVFEFLGGGIPVPLNEVGARTQIIAALAARAQGDRFAYAQLDVVTGEFIGSTSYYEINPAHRSIAIGHTWLGKRWWRTGHNTDSKLVLLTHSFEVLGAARVVWHTDILNTRSQAAIERLGATREAVLRKHRVRPNGTWRDTVQYCMTDEDWPEAKQRLADRLNAG